MLFRSCTTISPTRRPDAPAGEFSETAVIITPISFTESTTDSSTIAGVPKPAPTVSNTQAKTIFIKTPAKRIKNLCQTGREIKLSGLPSPSPPSPKILTKPPKGKGFTQYTTSPFLNLKSLGGNLKPNSCPEKPKPNSSTFIL